MDENGQKNVYRRILLLLHVLHTAGVRKVKIVRVTRGSRSGPFFFDYVGWILLTNGKRLLEEKYVPAGHRSGYFKIEQIGNEC